MKIAYLALTHNNPQILERTLKVLSSDTDCGFFIHVDQKADQNSFTVNKCSRLHFCSPRLPIYWGEFSIVAATLKLMREAMEHSNSYDYFVLLSGSDYPLRSGKYIRTFFEHNRGSEFISLIKMPAPGYPLSKINTLRYSSEMPVRRFLTRAIAKAGLAQRDFEKLFGDLVPYSGSQWWAISRSAARYILEFATLRQEVTAYFQKTFTADEMFFHTILGNSSFYPNTRRNLTYLDWPTPGNHPMDLQERHVSFFESQEEVHVEDEWGAGEVLFARKFSDSNLALLDRLDRMIIEKDARLGLS